MNLIYFTIGHDPNYVKLLEFCIGSIHDNSNMDNLDILIICDENFVKYVKHLNTKIFVTDSNNSAVQSSMRKLEIFDYPNIKNYENALYLDSDLIVCDDLNLLFHNVKNDVLSVYKEKDWTNHNNIHWSLENYSPEELSFFEKKEIGVFNCGQFLFKIDESMKENFTAVRNLISNYKGSYFYEQSFMNYYFNLRQKIEYDALCDKVILFPTNYIKKPILHFCGCGDSIEFKLDKMIKMYEEHKNYS